MHEARYEALQNFFSLHSRIAVLSGAGCSTASGIPEYRDDNGDWKHSPPVQIADFLKSAEIRQRYWARSLSGWQRVSTARPNAAHLALAALADTGNVSGVITQNVDNLHRRAGSRNVIDLHGTLIHVRCLDCNSLSCRDAFQQRLLAANPAWKTTAGDARPDGDADLGNVGTRTFSVPGCPHCGGVLKPDVVFFGENVPRERVAAARALVAASDALLVVGSSLMVFSGLRFVRQAHAAGKTIAILNRGRTRGDDIADILINEDCGEQLNCVATNHAASLERSA